MNFCEVPAEPHTHSASTGIHTKSLIRSEAFVLTGVLAPLQKMPPWWLIENPLQLSKTHTENKKKRRRKIGGRGGRRKQEERTFLSFSLSLKPHTPSLFMPKTWCPWWDFRCSPTSLRPLMYRWCPRVKGLRVWLGLLR